MGRGHRMMIWEGKDNVFPLSQRIWIFFKRVPMIFYDLRLHNSFNRNYTGHFNFGMIDIFQWEFNKKKQNLIKTEMKRNIDKVAKVSLHKRKYSFCGFLRSSYLCSTYFPAWINFSLNLHIWWSIFHIFIKNKKLFFRILAIYDH